MSVTIKRIKAVRYFARRHHAALRRWPVAALVLIAIFASVGSLRLPPRDSLSHSARLAASGAPKSCDLGTIAAGGKCDAELRLFNACDRVIEIARVRTSCPCVQVTLLEHRIGPRQPVIARVRLDLAQEPEFVGGLCPEIEFLDAAGRSLFVRTLNATVVRRPMRP